MTEVEARASLSAMVQATAEPVLTTAELDLLVLRAKAADTDGRGPADTGWVPTWNLRHAAAEGWRWKAGKVAGRFRFTTDGQGFDRQQMHEMCLAMVRHYLTARSVPVGSALLSTDLIGNVNGG